MSVALSSWKEIAAYLGKGVRTVQRWELQFGLPVRRPNAKSHVIFAVPSELDAWIKSHQHAPHNHRGQAVATIEKQRTQQRQLLDRLKKNKQLLKQQISRITRLLNGYQAPTRRRSGQAGNDGSQKTRLSGTAA
jgi:hypothetical protein